MGSERTFVQGKMEVAGIVGPLWFGAWLFTLGYCHLHVPQAIFALVLWPYYLGQRFG